VVVRGSTNEAQLQGMAKGPCRSLKLSWLALEAAFTTHFPPWEP